MPLPVKIEVIADAASYTAALGTATAATERFGVAYKSQFAEMSTATLGLATAQDKLAIATERYGVGTTGAARATLAYRREVEGLAAASKAAEAAQLGAMRSVGRAVTTFVTAPVVLAGYEAVKMGISFQRQMLLIQTQAGASAAEVKSLSGAVLDLAHSTTQGPEQLAQGLFHLESLGLRGSAAMRALKISSLAASTGMANLEDVASALGGAVVTGIKGTQDYSQAMGILNATIGAGNMHMSDLLDALGTGLLPKAKNAGLSLQEVGAALAVLTDRGIPAQKAATQLGTTFALMQAPSKEAKKALADMGIGANQLRDELRGPNGLANVLETLQAGMQKVGKERGATDILSAFGRSRQSGAILTLVESLNNGISNYNGKFAQIGAQSGAIANDIAKTQQTAAFKIGVAWSSIRADLTKFGGDIAPGIGDLAVAVDKLVAAFDKLPGPVKAEMGILIGIFAVGGPLLIGIAAVKRAIDTLGIAFKRLPATAGPAIAETDAELATLGTTATTAGTEAGAGLAAGVTAGTTEAEASITALRLSLLGLGALAIPAIAIPIYYDFLKSHQAYKGGPSQGIIEPKKGGPVYAIGGGHVSGMNYPGVQAAARAALGDVTTHAAGNINRSAGFGGTGPAVGPKGTTPPPGPLASFALPQSYANELAKAQAGYGSIAKADADIKNYILGLIKTRGFVGKGIEEAYNELASVDSKAATDINKAAAAAKRAVTHDQLLAQARLDLAQNDTAAARSLLEKDKARLEQELQQAKSAELRLTITKQLTTVENLLKTKQASFVLSLRLQEQEARANALAALGGASPTALQIRLAEKVKSVAMRAIDSNTLTMQGLIDAWNIVGQANQTLVGHVGGAKYAKFNAIAATAGLGLSHEQRVAIEERYAQVDQHGGKVPTGPAALGIGIGPVGTKGPVDRYAEARTKNPPSTATAPQRDVLNLEVNLMLDRQKLGSVILKDLQKRARRNAPQARGLHGGHVLALS